MQHSSAALGGYTGAPAGPLGPRPRPRSPTQACVRRRGPRIPTPGLSTVTAQSVSSRILQRRTSNPRAGTPHAPNPHNRKNPVPPPPPTFLASSRIHFSRNSSSVILAGSMSRVLSRAPVASNDMMVGTEEMTYVLPKPSRMMSGESYSMVQSATPPSASPAPDSTRE